MAVDTTQKRYVNCEHRTYLIGEVVQFNDLGNASLYEVELKPEDAKTLDLEGKLLYKSVTRRTLDPGQSWRTEVAQLKRLIAAGMRTAYEPTRRKTAFARNIAFPVDYRLDGTGRIVGVVVPFAPPHMFRKAIGEGDRRPQGIHHLISDARNKKVDERDLVPVVRRLAGAVNLFHSLGFSHGDLSGNNVLCSVDPNPSVYIIDCDGASDLDGNFGERGATPGWRDPRVDANLISRMDRSVDDYLVSLIALRAVLLNSTADPEAFQAQRRSIQDSVSPRVFTLLCNAFDDPERTDDRPVALDWLKCTDELSRQKAGFTKAGKFADNVEQSATVATAGLIPTRVDPRVGPRGKSPKPARARAGASPLGRAILAWRESSSQRAQVRAKAKSDRRRARPVYALASLIALAGLVSASDPTEFSYSAAQIAASQLPLFAGCLLGVLILAGLGFLLLRFAEALFGDAPPSGFFADGFLTLATWLALLVAPVLIIYWSLTSSDTGLYLAPTSLLCAFLFVPALMICIALVRVLVSLTSQAPRVNAKRVLRLLELGVIVGLSVFAVNFAGSWERAQEDAVYDEAASLAADRLNCRTTSADLPLHFRAWRASDISCRADALQGRSTVLTSKAATRALASSRARTIRSRSVMEASSCRTSGGAYVGEITNGQLLCYSQGGRSVIEWSNTAENVYYRLSGRVGRSKLYSSWRESRDSSG